MNLEILAYELTPLGPLCLRRRELLSKPGTFVTEVTLNHEFLMSSLYSESERSLARIALEMLDGTDLHVFVAGLGLGYTAWEALRTPRVVRVEVLELLPSVINWLDRGLTPLSNDLKADSRMVVKPFDAFQRLSGPPTEQFDLILIDVDHSPEERLGDGSDSFYTEQGLRAARRHLRPGGILGVWSYAESSPFVEAIRVVFQDVHVESIRYLNDHIHGELTDWLFFARG